MRMLFTLLDINVYIYLFINVICPAPGLKMSSFTRVFNVSISEYVNYIISVHEKISSPLRCATTCEEDCFAIVYDPGTKECKTYSKELCAGGTKAPTVKVYVKKRMNSVNDPADCSQINSAYCSGIYRIKPTPGLKYHVYCDLVTKDGPWTVIQNRQDGQVNFYRNWTEYKYGFGDLMGNFWLGLEIIHLLTKKKSILRIELVSWLGDMAYAQYSSFSIEDEARWYTLSVSGFSGNASYDAMSYHVGQLFTTFDYDNSINGNCAVSAVGAWWYKRCYDSNLNGPYEQDIGVDIYPAMVWYKFYHDRRSAVRG